MVAYAAIISKKGLCCLLSQRKAYAAIISKKGLCCYYLKERPMLLLSQRKAYAAIISKKGLCCYYLKWWPMLLLSQRKKKEREREKEKRLQACLESFAKVVNRQCKKNVASVNPLKFISKGSFPPLPNHIFCV